MDNDKEIKIEDDVTEPVTTPVVPEKAAVSFHLPQVEKRDSSKIVIEDEKYGTLYHPMASSRVRFAASENVCEIPGRSAWQRVWRPCCTRALNVFCTVTYMMCFPFIELFQFCLICCQRLRCDGEKKG